MIRTHPLSKYSYSRNFVHGQLHVYTDSDQNLSRVKTIVDELDTELATQVALRELVTNALSVVDGGEFGALFINDQNVNAVVCNGSALLIVREGSTVTIAKSTSGSFQYASGLLIDSDILLMTSQRSEDYLKNISFSDGIEAKESVVKIASDHGIRIFGLIFEYKAELVSVGKISPDNFNRGTVSIESAEKKRFSLPSISKKNIIVSGDPTQWKPPRKGKTASYVGLLLLALLGISIFFGIRQKRVHEQRAMYLPQLEEAQFAYEEAIALSEVSPDRARELVLSAKDSAESLKDKGIEDPDLDELLIDIRRNVGEIAGIYSPDISSYLTLSLISDGFTGSRIDLSDGVVRVLDSEGKRLAGVEVGTKRTSLIAGPEYLPDAIGIASYTDRSFILSRDGIREVGDEVVLVIKPEWDPQEVLISAFAGNIYVLDTLQNRIYRHIGVRGGFLESEDWLSSGLSVNVSDSVAWSIDGAIWVLGSDGTILKFMQGGIGSFRLSGLDEPFQNPRDIFTDESLNDIYVLDPQNARIVVLTKSGQFVAEYVSDGLRDAQEIVVSEEYNTLLFLEGDKLFSFELTHRR